MYDAWRSFLVGVLDGVISLLGIVFFLEIGTPWMLSITIFGIVLAWNFVPVEGRRIKFIEKVQGAQNGIALFGWALPTILTFLALVLFAH